MKKLLIIFLLTATVVSAGPKQAAKYIRCHVKETFTDMRHDPLWATLVIGSIVVNGLDAGTTAYGVQHGYQESNAFWGHRPSATKISFGTAGLTLMQLTTVHMLREDFTNSCKTEAANPDSRWWKTTAHTHNSETCKYGLNLAPMAIWPLHGMIIKHNLDLLSRK